MTRPPCDKWCPFGLCESCPYQGGGSPVAQGISARMGAAPEGASTPFRGLTHSSDLTREELAPW